MAIKTPVNNTPQGALAQLWRNVVKDTGIGNNIGYLITRYVKRNSSDSKTIKRRTRSTIEADISASELTWKKFTHILFEFLGVVRMDISIKLTYSSGNSTLHTVGVVSTDSEPVVLERGETDTCTQNEK